MVPVSGGFRACAWRRRPRHIWGGRPGETRVAFPRQPNTAAWGAAPNHPKPIGRDRLHLRRRSAQKRALRTPRAPNKSLVMNVYPTLRQAWYRE